jgi:hypothetical protein
MEKTRSPEFKPKVTPQQVAEKLANDRSYNAVAVATSQSEKAAVKKTSPPVTKEKTEKPKKATKKDTPLTFPVGIRVNAYGFIGIRKGLLETLGWHKGMALKIERNADGSVTLRKA